MDKVKTFGRWESEVAMRYVREAHISDMARDRLRACGGPAAVALEGAGWAALGSCEHGCSTG